MAERVAVSALAVVTSTRLMPLGDKHAGVIQQLPAIGSGNGVGVMETIHIGFIVAFQQKVVIALGGHGRHLGRIYLLAASGKTEQQDGKRKDWKKMSHFCRIKILMGQPVMVQFSRILFSRKRR